MKSQWELRLRRDVAPIYVHILDFREYYADDADFGDNINQVSRSTYAIGIDAEAST